MGRELQRLMVNQPNQSHTLTHLTQPPNLPPSHPFVRQFIHPAPSPPLHCGRVPAPCPSVPAVVLDHVGQLDDELALFILLTALKGMFLEGVTEDRRDRETPFHSDDRWIENNDMFISLTESKIV